MLAGSASRVLLVATELSGTCHILEENYAIYLRNLPTVGQAGIDVVVRRIGNPWQIGLLLSSTDSRRVDRWAF